MLQAHLLLVLDSYGCKKKSHNRLEHLNRQGHQRSLGEPLPPAEFVPHLAVGSSAGPGPPGTPVSTSKACPTGQ